jgi:agmatinase
LIGAKAKFGPEQAAQSARFGGSSVVTHGPVAGAQLVDFALKLLGLVAAEGLCGLEVVEVSPPYDTSDITALLGVRVVVEALGAMVAHGKLGSHKAIIDKPVTF